MNRYRGILGALTLALTMTACGPTPEPTADLAALQRDAHLTADALGEVLHLSPSQAGRRRQRLEAAVGADLDDDDDAPRKLEFDDILVPASRGLTGEETAQLAAGYRLKTAESEPSGDLPDAVVEQFGTPLDLYHHPQNLFVAGFIGSPRMNFLAGEIAGGRDVRLGAHRRDIDAHAHLSGGSRGAGRSGWPPPGAAAWRRRA